MEKLKNILVEKHAKAPLYLQISQGIEALILNHTFEADEKLPAIRSLAQYFSVNNVTIVKAYDCLEDKSLIYKIRGSGNYVTPQSEALIAEISAFDNTDHLRHTLSSNKAYHQSLINFASATPKAHLFPVGDFKQAINRVLDRDLGEAFSYQEAKGYSPLRDSICHYLKDFNIQADPQDIQVISGAQQGLDIVSKSMLDHNDVVIVEAPTYSGAIATFRSRGVKIIEVPILVDGVSMEKLEALIKRHRPKLMFTMTHCQNPTGYSYSSKKKKALLDLAHQYNFYILEDDYVGELLYTSQDMHALKALDDHQRVIYLKSFSKILMPGLRLGFMIVPDLLANSVLNAKEATDISTSGLIQKAFDMYLRAGHWSKQLKHMKAIYKSRYETMIQALNDHLPRRVNYYVPKGGIMFWLELPKGLSSRKFYEFLDKTRLVFVPGDMFYYSMKTCRGIRLSIASVTEEEIRQGIPMLCDEIKRFMQAQKKTRT